MGVSLMGARRDDSGAWHYEDLPTTLTDPMATGYTYTTWRRLMDGLCIAGDGAHYTVGHMPIAMLRRHLRLAGVNVQEGYVIALELLCDRAERDGYAHIGWA